MQNKIIYCITILKENPQNTIINPGKKIEINMKKIICDINLQI